MKYLIIFLFPLFAGAEGFSCNAGGADIYVGSVDLEKGTGSFSELWEYSHHMMEVTVGAYMLDRVSLTKELKDGSLFYFVADYYLDPKTKSEFDARIAVYGQGPVEILPLNCKFFEVRP